MDCRLTGRHLWPERNIQGQNESSVPLRNTVKPEDVDDPSDTILLVSEIPLSVPLRDLSPIIQSIGFSRGYEENLTTWIHLDA